MLDVLKRIISQCFPDFWLNLEEITDPRKKKSYELREILFAAISMFVFKQPSRNHLNMNRKQWAATVRSLFGVRLPHADTVDDVLKKLEPLELEQLQASLVRSLIERKTFKSGRLCNKYYLVAVDMTGVMAAEVGAEGTTMKESKNGNLTASRQVLEIKLVTAQGFAVSLMSEWVESDKENPTKEDCELNAFKRAVIRLKALFPKLEMCLLVDSLYPSEPFMKICSDNDLKFIAVLKDGKLKTLWDKIDEELLESEEKEDVKNMILEENRIVEWVTNLSYRGFQLSWIEELKSNHGQPRRCAWITNLDVDHDSVAAVVAAAHTRWAIEDAFNTQKNRGYNLGHKFSRTSFKALRNYYTLSQIGHLLSQLLELSQYATSVRKSCKITVEKMWSWMVECLSSAYDALRSACKTRLKLRYPQRA